MLWGTKGNSAKPSMPQMVWVWLLLFVLLFPQFCFSIDSRIDGDEQLQPHGGKSKSLKVVAALTVTPITSNSAQVESPHPYAVSADYFAGSTAAPSYSDPSGYQVHVNSLDDGAVNEDACLSESGLSCTLRLQTLHNCFRFYFYYYFIIIDY